MDWQAAFRARAAAAYAKTYWVNAPQGTALPYATLLDVTDLRPQTLGGWDLEFARVQIDVWGLTYADVQSGMETLLTAWSLATHRTATHSSARTLPSARATLAVNARATRSSTASPRT
jgi:hypothetical protein